MAQNIKIKFDDNGVSREIEVRKVVVTDKDGNIFRISQDFVAGIEILADGLDGKIYVEPHTSNQITVLTK